MAAAIALPDKFELIQRGPDIEIVRKWFNPGFLAAAVFALVWNAAMFAEIAKPGAIDLMLSHPSLFNLFPAIFGGAGIALLYYAAAGMVNRTRISVSRERLVVRHGPLPWLGNSEHSSQDLKSLYLKSNPTSKGYVNMTFQVLAITKAGASIRLVGGLSMTLDQASFLKQEIEKNLGIKDVPPGPATLEAEGKLALIRRGTELEIVTRWFNGRTIGMTVFSVTWLAFVGFLAWSWVAAIGPRRLLSHETDIGLEAIPLLVIFVFLGVGFLLAYRSAAEWLNRTSIKASPEKLSVRHGPLPWPGNKEVAGSAIKALQVRNARWSQGSGTRAVYKLEVHALLLNGKTVKLIGGLDTLGEANLIQKEIEGGLGHHGAPSGAQGDPGKISASQDVNSPIGRAVAGLFGFAGVAAGLFLVGSVVELCQQGYPLEHQAIRVLAGAWLLSFGGLFLGAVFRGMSARVANGLFIACFVLPIMMFILIAFFGTGFSKAPYFPR